MAMADKQVFSNLCIQIMYDLSGSKHCEEIAEILPFKASVSQTIH